jgi:hypothetical protein
MKLPASGQHRGLAVAYSIEHSIRRDGVEVVTVDGKDTYIVDRDREELRNVSDPSDRLILIEQQFGRDPERNLEILERYEKEGDKDFVVVLDSSPTWLTSLRQS